MRTLLHYQLRSGFTVMELMLVIGMLAVISFIILIAINPTQQLGQARDSQRRQNIREIEKAVIQYIIDGNDVSNVPAGIGNARAICQETVTGTNCTTTNTGIDLSGLVPTYMVGIPTDPNETGATLSGYFGYTDGAFYKICSPTLDANCGP